MGTKATQQHNSKTSSSSNKITSPTWLLNWFSQLTKPSNHSIPPTQQSTSTSSVILPWKKDNNNNNTIKAPSTSSVLITEPINVPTHIDYNTSSSYGSSTIKINNKKKKANNKMKQQQQQQMRPEQHRPSITISLTPSTERRNSQQTTCSSINTSDSTTSYYRRDSNSDRSVLSELWSKARKRHPNYPRFHWPHRSSQSNSPRRHEDQHLLNNLRPSSVDYHYYDSSIPSSYNNTPRQQQQQQYFPKHLKRHSISSSLVASTDNTPSGSRPNSVIYSSQPASPNFAALLLVNNNNNRKVGLVDDDHIDAYWLNNNYNNNNQQQHEYYCCQHGSRNNNNKKLRWEIKHELAKLAVDGLFSIPELVTQQNTIEKHVLQIGCGDASWAMDVASQYPRWMVIGLDDDETMGMRRNSTSSTPKNFKFIKCGYLLQGLKNLPDATFDIIASRFLILGYPYEQYQLLMTECIRVCKPGGFIEVMEMDLRIYHQRLLSSSITHMLNSEVIKVIESKSLDPRLARRLQDLILDETSCHSEIKYISLPLGVWGGKLGVMFRDDVHTLVESFQEEVADQKEKQCRTEVELEYKTDIMDSEMDSNRAFMNLHLMVVHV